MAVVCKIGASSTSSLFNEKGEKIFNSIELAKYTGVANAYMGRLFRNYLIDEGWSINDLTSNKNNINRVYNNIREYLIQDRNDSNTRFSAKAKEGIDKMLANWGDFQEYHKTNNNLVITDAKFEEEDDVEFNMDEGEEAEKTEDTTVDVPDSFRERGNDKSTFDLLSNQMRTLFKMLPRAIISSMANMEIVEEFDEDGLPVPSDFDSIFNLLSEKLAGVSDEDEFVTILTSDELIKVIPEVKFLNEMIRTTDEKSDMNSVLLFASFHKVFSRPMVSIYSSKLTVDGKSIDFIHYKATKGNRLKIEKTFVNNFISGSINEELANRHTVIDEKSVANGDKYNGYGRRRLDSLPTRPSRVIPSAIETTATPVLDFLELIGFKFSGLEKLTTDVEKEYFAKTINSLMEKVYESLERRLKANNLLFNPWKDLEKKSFTSMNKVIDDEKSTLKALLDLEGKYSKISPSLVSINATGEKQYELAQHNAITVAISYLNRAKSVSEMIGNPLKNIHGMAPFTNLIYNPLFKASYYSNLLFDEKGNRIMVEDSTGKMIPFHTLVVRNYNGVTIRDIDYMTANLSKSDKFISDFMNLIQIHTINTVQLEAKQSAYSINILNKDGHLVLPYDISNFDKGYRDKFADKMIDYLKAEISRIKSYNIKKQRNPELSKEYAEFSTFSEILSDENLIDLLEKSNIKLTREMLMDAKSLSSNSIEGIRFIAAVSHYFNRKVEDLKAFAGKNNITLEDLVSNQIREAYGKTPLNEFGDDQIGAEKVVDIDALLKMFIGNTFVLNTEFMIFVGTDSLFIEDYHKRLGMFASSGNLTSVIKTVNNFIKGDEEFQRNFTYSPSIAMGYQLRDNSFNYYSAVLADLKDESNAYAKGLLRAGYMASQKIKYIELTEAQAKEFLAEDAARDIKQGDGAGMITLDGHRELSIRHQFWTEDLEIAYKYEGLLFKKQKGLLSKAGEQELLGYERMILTDPDKYAIPVLKYTTISPIQNATIDIKAGDKFSLMPLLPSRTIKHPQMAALHEAMMKRQIMYSKFKSGSKLSIRHIYKSIDELARDHKTEGGTEPDLLATELLKEQLTVHIEQKLKSVTPTQFIKLLFANLFNEGIPVTNNARRLRGDFIKFLNDIRDQQTDLLYKKLGFTIDKNNGNKILDFNAEQLVEKIRQEVRRQKLNSNHLDSLETTDSGKFVNDLETSGSMRQIMDYLTGAADKFLRRYKTNQADFVLISSAFQNENSKLKYLEYDDKNGTHKMECRVTLTKEFVKLLNLPDPGNPGEKIGNVDTLNLLLEDESFVKKYEKSLTIVFSRVPIDGPGAMGTAIVKEFIFPTAGNVLQLPIEFMHQAGIDFDYDKEKVMMPSLSEYGLYVPHDLNVVENRIKELKQERNALQYAIDLDNKTGSGSEAIIILRKYMKTFKDDLMKNRPYDKSTLNLEKDGDIISLEEKELPHDFHYANSKAQLSVLFNQMAELKIKKDQVLRILDALTKAHRNDDDFSNFRDVELDDYRENEEEYYKIIPEIEELENLFTGIVKKILDKEYTKVINEGFKYAEKIAILSNLASKKKESLHNKFTNLCSRTLSLPELFSEVVLPNTNRDVKKIATDNAKDLPDVKAELPKKGKTLEYQQNLKVFDIFYAAKALLGPYAIANVFHQVVAQQGTKINPKYAPRKVKGVIIGYDNINLHLLTDDQVESLRHISVDGRTQLSISNIKDVMQSVIQHMFKQMITSTVDSAKDPFFAELQQTFQNINETVFMMHLRHPLKNIIQMMNNPVILEYQRLMDVKPVGDNKIDVYKELLKRYGLGYFDDPIAFFRLIDDKQNIDTGWFKGLDYSTQFNLETLKGLKINENNNINALDSTGKMTQESFDNLRILAHFAMMGRHSGEFRNFKSLFNNDTTKVESLLQIFSKEQTKEGLLRKGMFDESHINAFEKTSIISPFMNDHTIQAIISHLFPVLSEKEVLSTMSEIFKDFTTQSGSSTVTRRLLPKQIENDFIHAILGTFGEYGGENITEYGKRLINKYVGNTTLIERLADFRKQDFYEDLVKEYNILSKFQGEPQTDIIKNSIYKRTENGITYFNWAHPIIFLSESDETVVQQENYIMQLKELISKDFGDNTEKIHNLVKDLFIAGMIQSGMTDSGIGYYKYIPTEFKAPLLKDAFNNFKSHTFYNDDQMGPQLRYDKVGRLFLDNFAKVFKQNNPRYFEGFKGITVIEYPHLGKPYNLTDLLDDVEQSPSLESLRLEGTRNSPHESTISMQFKNYKRDDVVADNIIDAIINGERTAYTRMESQENMDYWKDMKVGDFLKIRMEDREVLVRITKEMHQLEGSGMTAEQWSKLEGFNVKYFEGRIRPNIKEAWQMEYEIPKEGEKKKEGNGPINTTVKIVSDPWAAQSAGEGISVLRNSTKPNEHYGNPFSPLPNDVHTKTPTIRVNDLDEAVQAFRDWLATPSLYPSVEPKRRQWILDQINNGVLDNKTLLYYKATPKNHATALRDIVNSRSGEIKGVNIFTKSKDILGRALTNPNWGAKNDKMNYFDVETPYKAAASKYNVTQKKRFLNGKEISDIAALKHDMNLMYTLQLEKFRKHPELIDEINKRGGLPFIQASTHIVGVANSRWEGIGMQSNFIKVLAQSYTKVAKELGKFIDVKKETPSIKTPTTISFKEDLTTGYKQRTIKNASADATIALAYDFNSAGEILTKKSVENQGKRYIRIPIPHKNEIQKYKEGFNAIVNHIVSELNAVNAKTLNIAGNGIYTMRDANYSQEEVDTMTYDILKAVVESPDLKTPIESIRTGGQTGFDEAGAKAGSKLGISTEILAPKGWKFRVIDLNRPEGYRDISNQTQFKDRFTTPIKEKIASIETITPSPIKALPITVSTDTSTTELDSERYIRIINESKTNAELKENLKNIPEDFRTKWSKFIKGKLDKLKQQDFNNSRKGYAQFKIGEQQYYFKIDDQGWIDIVGKSGSVINASSSNYDKIVAHVLAVSGKIDKLTQVQADKIYEKFFAYHNADDELPVDVSEHDTRINEALSNISLYWGKNLPGKKISFAQSELRSATGTGTIKNVWITENNKKIEGRKYYSVEDVADEWGFSTSDVIDFIRRYPRGFENRATAKDQALEALKMEFYDILGVIPTLNTVEKVLDRFEYGAQPKSDDFRWNTLTDEVKEKLVSEFQYEEGQWNQLSPEEQENLITNCL